LTLRDQGKDFFVDKCDVCQSWTESCYISYKYTEESDSYEVTRKVCPPCRDEENFLNWVLEKEVGTSLLTSLILHRFDNPNKFNKEQVTKLRLFSEQLQVKTLEFQGHVWFDAGLQKFIQRQTSSKLSDKYLIFDGTEYTGEAIDIRCFSAAARFMITFENKKAQVTFITEENSPFHRLGWQSVNGKAQDILDLCDKATLRWGNGHKCQFEGYEPKFNLKPDENVSIF
jgi:hypothetical protein